MGYKTSIFRRDCLPCDVFVYEARKKTPKTGTDNFFLCTKTVANPSVVPLRTHLLLYFYM
jgi:hypothetical protein